MKHLSLILFLISSITFAQKKHIPSMNYEQSQDISFFRTVKQNTRLDEYFTKKGNSIKIGDTLVIGKPTNRSTKTTITSYSDDNTIANTSTRKEFQYIQMGKSTGLNNLMNAFQMEEDLSDMAGINFAGESVIVKGIHTYHRGSKKKPLYVVLVLGELNGRAFGLNKYMSVLNTELAIAYEEILLKNKKMTRADAIAKLKEAKELVELDIMSEKEYDKLKKELTPIIMNNKTNY